MRLETLVRRAAARTPDAPAVRAPDGQATYGELDRMADALAGALIERGVQPGDRVGIWIDKGLRAIAVMQAVLRCGAAYVPMDPRSPVARLQRIVDSCRPRVIATTTARARLSRSNPRRAGAGRGGP